jgi:Rrf2 family protein
MIMGELRQHGFVQIRKGKGGGYTLRKTPQQISLADVIRIFDGPIAPVPCLSKTAYRRCEECADPTTCAVRLVLRDPHEALLSAFEETTIADMVALENEAKAGIQRAPLRYSI